MPKFMLAESAPAYLGPYRGIFQSVVSMRYGVQYSVGAPKIFFFLSILSIKISSVPKDV